MKTILSILSLAGVMFITSCKNEQKEPGKIGTENVSNPSSGNGSADQSNVPVFTFDKETHDFGKITQGEKVSYNFKFKNTGKADLLISNATATCGCTVPDYPKQPVPPNAEGVITVTFDSAGKEGLVDKTVTITANTIPNTKVLTIKTEIIKP